MSGFALVSTVDSMGKDFPSHCVMLFETERDAVQHAVKCIVEHDDRIKYVADEELWAWEDEHYENPDDLLDAWQNGLGTTEYFHVKPVVGVSVG